MRWLADLVARLFGRTPAGTLPPPRPVDVGSFREAPALPGAVLVTTGLMRAACPSGYNEQVLAVYRTPVAEACAEFAITTPLAAAAFLATIAHESASFWRTEEIADGSAYEFRASLGNTQAGDGKRFKGRGLIQVTGRSNYEACAKYFNMTTESAVSWLLTPRGAARSAAWYFARYRPACLRAAEIGDLDAVTRVVNGGLNGIGDRRARYASLLRYLKATTEV